MHPLRIHAANGPTDFPVLLGPFGDARVCPTNGGFREDMQAATNKRFRLLIRPDGQLVSTWIGEVEAPTARK